MVQPLQRVSAAAGSKSVSRSLNHRADGRADDASLFRAKVSDSVSEVERRNGLSR